MKAENSWGHCSNCKYFDSLAKTPLPGEEANCREPTLAKFQLRVFGTCGCNHFQLRAGLAKAAEAAKARAVGARI